MKKNIKVLNKKNILSGKIKDLIPELYELKEVIEDNDGHPQEPVFDHTLSVLSRLEKIFLKLRGDIKKRLNERVDKNTRKMLLKLAALFHDIGKKETLIVVNGITDAPGHDRAGAEKTRKILNRFDLSKRESDIVVGLVANHMKIYYMLKPGNPNFQKEFVSLKNKLHKTIYPELILLAFADIVNGGERKTRPKDYKRRIDFYKKEIEKMLWGTATLY